ncbi:MAG: hypothetical protein ACFFCW_44695 [Candidatus Hodarchaeota archaeon]|nr:MAG: hypothetical protein JSW12_19910 [Deltaproteobacteria bacterium]
MVKELRKQYELSRNSHLNTDEKTNPSNPPKSKLPEVEQVQAGSEFSLGPGLGCIPLDSLHHLISFHGYLTTGAFIGLQMLALGKRLLGIEENRKWLRIKENHDEDR